MTTTETLLSSLLALALRTGVDDDTALTIVRAAIERVSKGDKR